MLHPFSDLTPILPSATVHLPFQTVPGVPAFPDEPASVGTIVGVIVGILIIIIIVCGLVLLKYKWSWFLLLLLLFCFRKGYRSLFVLQLYIPQLNRIQPIIFQTGLENDYGDHDQSILQGWQTGRARTHNWTSGRTPH